VPPRGTRGGNSPRICHNALHHRSETIGALRRQVLLEAELGEHRSGIGQENFIWRLVLVDRKEDCDEAANNMRVAVPTKAEERRQLRIGRIDDVHREPDLAGAAANLVGFRSQRVVKGGETAPQFDHVPVAVFPIVQEREIGPNGVERHRKRLSSNWKGALPCSGLAIT
jgi:hypothetical protein